MLECLKEYFYEESEIEEKKEEVPDLKKKSHFIREKGRNKWPDAHIDAVKMPLFPQ